MPGYGPAIRLTPWFLRRFISLCVIVVSLFLASGVLAQRVVVLRDGESVSGQLTTSAPVVVYQLDGLASDQINVRAIADTNLYPRLSLLDANFNAIAFSSSPLTGSENAREALLTVSLPASGRYSLVVTSASGALGGYTLSLGVTAALTPTTTQILFPLLQTATAWAAGTAPAIPTAQPAALTQAAISGNLGSALETALAETASPTPYCAPNSMLPCNFPTSTPISNTTPTPWPPLMGSFEVPVSSLEPTVFSEIISGPGQHRIRLRFTDLTGPIQPQQFRIALDCDNGIGLLLWQGNDCGDSYTEIIESADTTPPFRDLTLNILVLDPPTNVPYQLTITPETPFAAVATPDGDHVFDAFSNQSASFTSDISRPLGDPADRVTVRFPDAVGAQAQTYRFTLTCASGLATALLAGELHCGDSVTQSIGGTNTGEVPVVGFEFAFLDGSLAAYVSYTLTVSPETGLVAQAPPDADFLLNVPLTSQTTFSDEISSPQGDAADKITVRVPDLFTGSWDFTLNLLCDGTGVEFVQWSLQTGQTLACGDSLTLPLTSTSVNPVPNLVMFVALPGQSTPSYVHYTLLVTPSGAPAGGAPATFDVSLDDESELIATIGAGQTQNVLVRVPAVTAGMPRTIAFSLICAGGPVQATLYGVSGPLGCGSTFQRVFADPAEQSPFTVQATGTGMANYILRAAPLYSPVAPADQTVHELAVRPLDAVTLAEALSAPEGDRIDQIVLDTSELRAADLPRTYTITLDCEGVGRETVTGGSASGVVFGCGSGFEHTFAVPEARHTDGQVLPTRSTGPGLNLTADTSLSLSLTIALPEGAPAGLLNYVLRAVPSGLDLFESPTITENDYLIEVSSTGETTFSQTLAGDQLDQLSLRFPQLVNAHPQTFVLTLSCSGVGTSSVVWTVETGQTQGCGSTFTGTYQTGFNGGIPVSDHLLTIAGANGIAQVSYTLQIVPVTPYTPVAANDDDRSPYQLAVSILDTTSFSNDVSGPLGDQVDHIQAIIPDMIGGQAAGRDFTFWLTCDGANAINTRYQIELPGSTPIEGLCGVPLTLYLDESIGSPPLVYIRVIMQVSGQPAYSAYTLAITPAGADLPFVVPMTPSPTPFVLQAITIAPTATPTPIPSATLSPTPIPVRASATLAFLIPTSTPTLTPIPLVNSPPIGEIGNPGALCLNGTCTPTPTSAPAPVHLPAASLLSPADGAVVSAQPATLSWAAVPGASYYLVTLDICIDLSVECASSTVAESKHLTTTSTSLLVYWGEPRNVRWQVSAFFDPYSSTAASLARLAQAAPPSFPVSRQFRAFAAPQVFGPNITSPAYGSTSVLSPFTLTWSTSPGADSYHVTYLFCSTAGDNCITTEYPLVEGTSHQQDCQPGRPRVTASVQAYYDETVSRSAFSNPPVLFWCNLPTPTSVNLQMITLAPSATPTLTATATNSPTPIPVRASATLALFFPSSTPTATATPIPPVNALPGAEIGNPGALCLSGTCTPTPTRTPTRTPTPDWPKAQLLAPANGAVLTSQPVTLSWSAVPGAQHYHVLVANLPAASSRSFDTEETSLTLYWGESSEVRWEVHTVFGSGTSYSAESSFEIVVEPGTQIEILSPTEGSFGNPSPFTVTWSEIPGAIRYSLKFEFCDYAYSSNCVTDYSIYGVETIIPNATLYCQPEKPWVRVWVRALLSSATYTAFSFATFWCIPPSPTPTATLNPTTTLAPFPQPVNTLGPLNTATPTATATAAFLLQQITLAPSATPTPFLLQAITLGPTATPTSTSTQTPTATPIPLATAAGGRTGLEPLRPAHLALINTQPVTLSWTAQPDSPRYELEITVCDTVSGDCVTEQPVATRASYSLALAGNAEVSWRVRVLLTSGRTSEYTTLHTFEYVVGRASPAPTPTAFASRNG